MVKIILNITIENYQHNTINNKHINLKFKIFLYFYTIWLFVFGLVLNLQTDLQGFFFLNNLLVILNKLI